VNALPSSPPPASWSEPGPDELEPDTLPCPPPALDGTVLPTIELAARDAARLTAAGIHKQARDSLRMAFMLAGDELGLSRNVLAALGDLIDRMAP
jgi:hypothetical protein